MEKSFDFNVARWNDVIKLLQFHRKEAFKKDLKYYGGFLIDFKTGNVCVAGTTPWFVVFRELCGDRKFNLNRIGNYRFFPVDFSQLKKDKNIGFGSIRINEEKGELIFCGQRVTIERSRNTNWFNQNLWDFSFSGKTVQKYDGVYPPALLSAVKVTNTGHAHKLSRKEMYDVSRRIVFHDKNGGEERFFCISEAVAVGMKHFNWEEHYIIYEDTSTNFIRIGEPDSFYGFVAQKNVDPSPYCVAGFTCGLLEEHLPKYHGEEEEEKPASVPPVIKEENIPPVIKEEKPVVKVVEKPVSVKPAIKEKKFEYIPPVIREEKPAVKVAEKPVSKINVNDGDEVLHVGKRGTITVNREQKRYRVYLSGYDKAADAWLKSNSWAYRRGYGCYQWGLTKRGREAVSAASTYLDQ